MAAHRRWHIPNPRPEAEALSRRLGVSETTAQVLLNRGLAEPADVRAFLRPGLDHLADPGLWPEMVRAACRIRQAVENRERIVIYGDYDVDGISATAILLRCLALLGVQAEFYIPDRLDEGYGLNADAVRNIARRGEGLLITVDCGIGAVEEVALARSLGLDVIVTDHHEPGEVVPGEAVLANPKLPGHAPVFRDLSGAGLAFKLAWALGKALSRRDRVSEEFRDFLLDAVSLAALGTIADVVPLVEENRVLAHFGLRGLSSSEAAGIRALREAADVEGKALDAFDVAFKLAPRLNAAGRLGSARRAVELLTTGSLERARSIAEDLNRENARRQRIQDRILQDARKMIQEQGLARRHSIVLASQDWHAGVVGIVAARIAEEFWRPTVLLVLEGDKAHGSARSVGSLHLFQTLRDCAGRLTAFGGHARAAGLRLPRSELDRFREEFERAVGERLSERDLTPSLEVDAEVRLARIDKTLVEEIGLLAPFGEGNPEPVFVAYDLEVRSGVRRMGTGGRHLSFWVNQDGRALRAVAFGMADLAAALERCRRCSLAFVPKINRWRGTESIELEVRDMKVAGVEG